MKNALALQHNKKEEKIHDLYKTYCLRVCSHVNRRVPDVLDWQTWCRQLNHMSVDSFFTVKCVANVFALLKCPSAVH